MKANYALERTDGTGFDVFCDDIGHRPLNAALDNRGATSLQLTRSENNFRRLLIVLVLAALLVLSFAVPAPWVEAQVVEGVVAQSSQIAAGRMSGGSAGKVYLVLPDETEVVIDSSRLTVPKPGDKVMLRIRTGFYGQRIVSIAH